MTITSNSQSPYFMTLSLISQQLQIVVDAWSWAPPLHDVAEESIYLCAQNGVSLGDMVQQRQRREWGIGFVPSFHPSSSALASMMEQSWLPPSPTIFSLYSTPCYPTPESLFYDDYSPMPSNLLDLLSDGGFESTKEYPDSAIEIPPDRDHCTPTTRETSKAQKLLLAGQARAGTTAPTSSAIESVEAPSTNIHLLNQPSGVEGQEMGVAPGEAAPSRSSSPSITPTSRPLSCHTNDLRLTLPSPAASASSPITSPTARPSSPPASAATGNTPTMVPSIRQTAKERHRCDRKEKKEARNGESKEEERKIQRILPR